MSFVDFDFFYDFINSLFCIIGVWQNCLANILVKLR